MNVGKGLHILLVEDNDDIRECLASLLEDEGYGVTGCETAEDGLARLKQRPFHLLVTDYMLPGRSGVWLLDEATRGGLLLETGVLMITAHPQVSSLPGARLLRKPLDIDEFLRTVTEAIASASPAGRERGRLAL